jgi:amino acid adenylation domain-containing protein
VVCIDQDWATIGQLAASDLAFEPAGSDLAYVIHTSGSTGRPKGVMISQSALGNWADASERSYGLRPDDRVLQFHSIGFDASVGDVFCTLAAGAELVIVPDPLRLSPEAMLEELPRLRPTVADLPTAYWHELVDELEGRPALPVGLRLVVIGGESALPEKMRRWQRYVDPRIRLANTYGPTESTVVATAWWLHAGFADRPMATVPIGRPVANVQAFVVDAELRACPIGVPGELLLGGTQLAVGYLGLPDETERRFLIRDPLGSGRPQRLYRTGDRARWLPSGDLEFLGRVDRQVKIRGVRVEPEEIEAALTTHPAVADAIVEAREPTPGDIQLVGYVVFRPYLQVSPADLHRHLALRLPAQVIPSAFVALERLPLTPAGKVDRRALPEPAPQAGGRPAQDVVASPLEQKIAGVWADVLGLASVAPRDNFFELGGHSLLAARLVSRLRRDLEVDLPVKAIFEAPTVEGLASRIEGALRGESAGEHQRLERG